MNLARDALQASSPVVRAMMGLVMVGLILVLAKWAAPVLTPIMLACFLAALVAPLHLGLEQRGVSSGLALTLLMVLMVGGMLLLAGLLWLSVQRLREGVGAYQMGLDGIESEIAGPLGALGITGASVPEALGGEQLARILLGFLGAVARSLGELVFALVLVAFLLLDARRLLNLVRTELRDLPGLGNLPEIAHTVITYFAVRTRLNLVTGVGVGLLALVLGVDYAPGIALHFVPITDCNENGIDDDDDIAEGTSADCQPNGVPDECDLAEGTSADTNANGVPDECEPEVVSPAEIFWTNFVGGDVYHAALDGTGVEELLSDMGVILYGIAVDRMNEHVYWGNWDAKIQRANLDGTDVEDVVATGPEGSVMGLALDVAGNRMYWGQLGDYGIFSATLSGTEVMKLVDLDYVPPLGAAVDRAAARIEPLNESRKSVSAAPSPLCSLQKSVMFLQILFRSNHL